MIPFGRRRRICSGVTECGTISEWTCASRIRRAINWAYCAPKSTTRTVSNGAATHRGYQWDDSRPGLNCRRFPRSEGEDQLRLGRLLHLFGGHPGGELTNDEAGVCDVEDGEIGDHPIDDAESCYRQRALVDDLVRSVLGDVLHHHDDPLRPVDKVHRPAHPLDELARHDPVGEIALL